MIKYAEDSSIPGTLPSLLETQSDIENYISSDCVLIAFIGQQAVGTIRLCGISPDKAEISRFAVIPSIQKTGIGGRLFVSAEKYLRESGYSYVNLHTALDNKVLLNFYISRGFVVESESTQSGYRRGMLHKKLQ